MEMEGREKRAAADHAQLVTRVSSALKESKRECQEEGERVRESLGARISDFAKVREHYSVCRIDFSCFGVCGVNFGEHALCW